MANILLLEPNYKNKYPPLGLMKISYFHKEILKDKVFFSKGKLRKNAPDIKWDRIYITTLFTFEWKETIKAIDYAKSLCDISKIFIGGISSTLMADEFENKTGIKPIVGLLNEAGKLGYPGDEAIDSLTPDYSILDDISDYYHYPYENAYFMYTTRGCGMNCGFCAVKTLEPTYIPYIPIKEQIYRINELYGEKKDLLLMDNNVLKSASFEKIIDELIELGFEKGATFKNPKTGKTVKRYVDFNQGLDAYLLSDKNAELLSKIAIRPARIAFDHIEDKETYTNAVWTCAKYNINNMSNYILYNSENFTGKGHSYAADDPAELYERLKINIKLSEDINNSYPEKEPTSIFSFPMRYIPLDNKKRGYVGSKWNPKYLRAIQTILIPTQGKVGVSTTFFYASFGNNLNEFYEILDMPEQIISLRGKYIVKKKLSDEENKIRFNKYLYNQSFINEWKRLYHELSNDELVNFQSIIQKNKFKKEDILKCTNNRIIKLLLFYLSNAELKMLFYELNNSNNYEMQKTVIKNYCTDEFPSILDLYIKYNASKKDKSSGQLELF
jgi:hypothetical protein